MAGVGNDKARMKDGSSEQRGLEVSSEGVVVEQGSQTAFSAGRQRERGPG